MNKNWLYIIIFIIIIFSFKDYGKYQGETAEEWFYRYDERDADYESLSISYEELYDDYQELKDEYEIFSECVDSYAYSNDYDDLTKIKYICL
jgi:hypothetical protein